jgi:type II secretory pathway pseudopilin PulG
MTLQRERGMSLVEATIILMVLGLLTSVVSPSVADYVNDAKQVKVKEDCEAIGVSIARLARDVGPCLKKAGTGACTKANRVDLLVSDGPAVTAADLGTSATAFSSADLAAPLNWDGATGANADLMESQLVTNGAGYATPADNGGYTRVGPQFNVGWRGAYLSGPVGPDPWGKRYMVNTAFLAAASDAAVPGWDNDVFCLSAGPNGRFETPVVSGTGTSRTGDDFTYVISGSTR